MSLKNLLDDLDTNNHGTTGVDLFIDTKPESVGNAVLLRQTGGYRDPYFQGCLRELTFQVVVQNEDYATGLAKAEAISEALTIRQETIGNAYFYRVDPLHEPMPFGRESSGVETFVVNCEANWREV